jgi:hypothetical protein
LVRAVECHENTLNSHGGIDGSTHRFSNNLEIRFKGIISPLGVSLSQNIGDLFVYTLLNDLSLLLMPVD